jgi:hypothetical protein
MERSSIHLDPLLLTLKSNSCKMAQALYVR